MTEMTPQAKTPGLLFRLWHALTFFQRMRRRLLRVEQQSADCARRVDELERLMHQFGQSERGSEHALQAQELRIKILEQDHAASVSWLQKTYPEIVHTISRKIEKSHLDHLAQDLLSAIHRETANLSERLNQVESSGGRAEPAEVSPLPGEDARSKAFYLQLERRFRGTENEIADRLRYYLPMLQQTPETATPVLDIGCGRGEWLEVLTEACLPASGVDLNPACVDYCRLKRLNVSTADALGHLAGLKANTVGTVSAFQLVEHISFPTLLALTEEILRVLKPGGLLIYETPNPENILVATRSFWIDPTHERPLPPEFLEFLVMQTGFTDVQIHRIHPDPERTSTDETLHELLSCSRDYAIVARKPCTT